MAHGETLKLRYLRRPTPDVFVAVEYDEKGFRQRGSGVTYTNPDKDRSLAGKSRIRARRAARRAA